ncbi:hypothetical protein CDD83_1509 [Cordyceps sp. RAO-2017]|nr:hypothetical protein CDD83_1509 [Cordyceps sp. RAO-2017]
MRGPALSSALAALLAAHGCRSEALIPELSFGHSGRLIPEDGPAGRIPHFAVSGQPWQPELLSNKVILTPVAPGNMRGAVWAEAPLERSVWTAEVEFRATGAERGGGNLNVWLAAQGARAVGSNSIYTVGKFDGLALVVDSHGGAGGMVRGFLNDGSVDFKQQSSVDRLAFGHCAYAYRNLGRPSVLRLRQSHDSFRLDVDGHACFETDKVSVPSGYHWGVTAATPDNPDSFELFKLVVSSDSTVSSGADKAEHHHAAAAAAAHHEHEAPQKQSQPPPPPPPDEPAAHFKTSQAQFEDLHNRLQGLMHHVSGAWAAVTELQRQAEQRHGETAAALDGLRRARDDAGDVPQRLRELEREVRAMRSDINAKLAAHHDSLQGYLTDHHATLAGTVARAVPGHGRLILVFVGSQLLLVAAYVVYKRRRASSPKKYL